MNQKMLIAIAALVIVAVAAGGFLLANNSSNNPQSPSQNEQTERINEKEEIEEEVEDEETAEDMEDEDSEETTVTLSASGFSPKTVTIKAGDKVVWVNESGKKATVDSNPHPVHTSYPDMNLGSFSDENILEFIFPESGTYNYHNHLNASQTGTVVVE